MSKKDYVDFWVYDKEMADDKGIKYKHWRECKDKGDWGLTDDGYVGELLKRYKMKKRKYWKDGEEMHGLKFTFAEVNTYPTNRLLFEPRLKTKKWTGYSSKSWQEIELRRARMIPVIEVFVQNLLAGRQVPLRELSNYYRQDGKYGWVLKNIMKTKEWRDVIKKEVREALELRNIDEGKVLDIIDKAVEIAQGKNDAGNMLKGADSLIGLLDMKPEKQQVTKKLEMSRMSAIEGQIEKEEENLRLEETTDGGFAQIEQG